jgi:dTDP-glucose 4,6-dehydratase
MSYYRSFGLPVKIVRPFNTYGPRQSARAIIPAVVTQIENGQREIYVGSLSPTRDLTYVDDTVNGFVEIFKSDQLIGQATNIGMNEEISMGDLVTLIARIVGADIQVKIDMKRVRPGNSEVERLKCDNTKIKSLTSWKPQVSLKKGLEKTIDWLKSHKHLYKAEIYNV